MKKVLTALLMVVAVVAMAQESIDKASVSYRQGVYIFLHSKPIAKYDYVGTIKINVAWMGDPKEMLGIALKKLKKDFPDANGIIFNDDMDRADAIKFKE